MKKMIAGMIAVCITAFMFLSLSADAKEVKYMCVYGDSIPAGYGLSKQSQNFANMLSGEYGLTKGIDFLNYSVSGATSGEILRKISATNDKVLQKADTVIISAGGNDIMNVYGLKLIKSAEKYRYELESAGIELNGNNPVSMIGQIAGLFLYPDKAEIILRIFEDCMTESAQADYQKAVDDFGKNMREMVEHIKNTGSQADIYFFALYDPVSVFAIDTDFFNSLDESIEAMREDVLFLAESDNQFHAVDVFGHFKGHYAEWTNIYKFDIHPNKEGHEQLYQITDKAIKATAVEIRKSSDEISEDIFESSFETEIPQNHDYIVWIIVGGIVLIAVVGAVIIAIVKNSE